MTKKMEEHTPTIDYAEASSYAHIGALVSNKFSNRIFEENIIKDVMLAVLPSERHPHTEEVIKQIVFNRRLMAERFL